jgi:hypothetical protein
MEWILDIIQLNTCENAVLSRVNLEHFVLTKYLPEPKFLSNMYIGCFAYQTFIFKEQMEGGFLFLLV